jgi:hypothetical protein
MPESAKIRHLSRFFADTLCGSSHTENSRKSILQFIEEEKVMPTGASPKRERRTSNHAARKNDLIFGQRESAGGPSAVFLP